MIKLKSYVKQNPMEAPEAPLELTDAELSKVGGGADDNPGQTPM